MFFAAGATMLASPLILYRRFNVRKKEFQNRFTTRVMGRALGVFFMMVCLGASSSYLEKVRPGVSDRLLLALAAVFGLIWVAGLLLGIAAWITPRGKAWAESHATDQITRRVDSIEIGIGVAVVLAAAMWAIIGPG